MNSKKIFLALLVLAIGLAGCKPKIIESSENGASAEKLLTVNDRQLLAARIETDKGEFELELFALKTPKTVENFVKLALKGYYNGITFHRVIRNFMIQGGDPTATGEGGESIFGKTFEDEIVSELHFDEPGMAAMANRGPNTNGSQFFITTVPTPWIDRRHTIFGKIISGMGTVMDISKLKVDENEKPVENITIKKIIIEKRFR